MGEVFLADDELLGRQVAIKFVRQADRPEVRTRFLLEARALARLSHPNVVTVHRVGEILGQPFIVSEWVKGKSLEQWPLPLEPSLVLRVALQLARAIAAAHRAGVVHRDIKPANVILSESLELKLVDFGVSSAVPEATEAMPLVAGGLDATQPLPGATGPAAIPRARLSVGTPLYAAPELLRGEPGTRLSDLYAWGAVLYEMGSGQPPYRAATIAELNEKAAAGAFAPLAQVGRELATLVHSCLSPNPRDRPQRAEALLETLEPLLAAQAGPLPEEPYRGLSVFGPEHAGLFFGREREIRAVVERLRASTFVLVAGDSGVGKSSLCRAGVLPQLQAGGVAQRRFEVISLSLGARPLHALAAALCGWLGVDEQAAADSLRSAPEQLAVRIRDVKGAEGRALFVDGLEDLVSLPEADELDALGRFLGALAVRSPVFRLLATARSDSLTRLAALPLLGAALTDALYLLRPLSDEGLRQAIEGPARAADFRLEPESMVDELVAAARVGPGALPLVQFALAELWRRRDPARRIVRREELAAMGGVGGALARHADEVMEQLAPPQRRAAEQLLPRLVTAQGTRARRTRADLLSAGGPHAAAVIRDLVASRILISGDADTSDATVELAHDALIQNWERLRALLGHDEQKRALAQRVERAAEEWERTGEGLWSRKLLRELKPFPDLPLGERERSFVEASRRAALRRRVLLAAAAVLSPLLVVAGVAGVRARTQAANRELALQTLRDGSSALAHARTLDAQEIALREQCFAHFDAEQTARAEEEWTRVRGLAAEVERDLEHARSAADSAMLISPDEQARTLVADLLVLRLERLRGNPLARERAGLLAQLAPLDSGGTLRAPFVRPARLRIDVTASLAGEDHEISPGSYVLDLAGGARLPILLRFGDRQQLKLRDTPRPPPGFVLVPSGRFLWGFDGDEDVRLGFFGAPPLHERESGAFAISATEVTFADWLSYLRALPPAERTGRTPKAAHILLSEEADGRYLLHIQPAAREYVAAEGTPLVYPGRTRNASVDWLRLPVTGVSFDDARAYAAFLSKTGRVPSARLCTEVEWERAARGADGRSFPGGDLLTGDDANIDETYGRQPLAFGPDPVGVHARSTSPVGAFDMAGNAWEMTVSASGAPALRGGSWYQGALTARSVNREPYETTARGLLVGFRLCTNAVSSP